MNFISVTLFIQTAGDCNRFRGQAQEHSSHDGTMRKMDTSFFNWPTTVTMLYPEYKATLVEVSWHVLHGQKVHVHRNITSIEHIHWRRPTLGIFCCGLLLSIPTIWSRYSSKNRLAYRWSMTLSELKTLHNYSYIIISNKDTVSVRQQHCMLISYHKFAFKCIRCSYPWNCSQHKCKSQTFKTFCHNTILILDFTFSLEALAASLVML